VRRTDTKRRDLPRLTILAALGAALGVSTLAALTTSTPLSQYGRDVWDSDSGLPQNSVDAILQTSDGYLWLGTQEGLVRFDGVRFTIFDTRNTPAMPDDWTLALRQTRDGTLWIGTGEGLVRERDGKFEAWPKDHPLGSAFIPQLLESRDGALWIASNKGLTRIDGKGTRVFTERDGWRSGAVSAVAEDARGRIWVGSRRALALFESGHLRPLSGKGVPDGVTALLADPSGGMWAGTVQGLVHIDDSGVRTWGPGEGLTNTHIQVLYRDAEGVLWIGTTGGLFRFWRNAFESLTRDNGGLSSEDVGSIFEDREGSLWVGTRDGGLNRLKDERIANYSSRQGLPDDRVWTVFEDREHNIWAGTTDGSLSRLAPGAAKFESVAHFDARVLALAQDPSGDLWVGTRGAGLFRMHGTKLFHFTAGEGFPAIVVFALCVDRDGSVWIGSGGTGLYRYRDGKITQYTSYRDGLAADVVFSLYQDRGGTLWIGTFGGGLSRFRDGKFTTLTARDGLAHNNVMSILEDAGGTFWFGTRGGLSRWKDGTFTSYRQATGLFHDAVQSVLADDRGYLWLTSNRGIFRVRSDELDAAARGGVTMLHPVGFTTAKGMRSVECNNGQHGGFRSHDGRFWFATVKGLAMADPGLIRLNPVPPKVVVESVVSGRQTLAGVTGLTLPPARRDLELHYTALSFRNPTALRFRYRLEGFDHGWIEAGGRRAAYYTNLPAGHYRFRVLAGNEDGVWSEEGAVSDLTLEQSLTESSWFRLLCLAAAAVLAWSAHRLRSRQLAAREALRAAVFEAKLSALQSQLQPHFLFNALNSLLPLVGSEPARAKKMIVRIGDLLRASLLSETAPMVSLERDLALLDEYLDIERMRFRDRIQIEIDADAVSREAQVPSFLLQPLVENAIKHAAHPRTGRVRIRIGARVEGEHLTLTVRDDGPGMPLAEAGPSNGIGLANIRRRLEMLYPGNHEFRTSNPPDGGCEVLIRIPFARAEEEPGRQVRLLG
jgi:ligand-binding sensor domain-containing protein/signal transduction histidine kinase